MTTPGTLNGRESPTPNDDRGDAALAQGNMPTARSNWLRAVGYYQAAAFPYDQADENHQRAIGRMRECAVKYLRHRQPAGEVVLIPWPGGHALEGYFLPAAAGSKPGPAVILHRRARAAKGSMPQQGGALRRRSRHVGACGGLLGAAAIAPFEEIVGRSDLESTIGHIMDYLVGRDDVDEHRIANPRGRVRLFLRGAGNRVRRPVCGGGLRWRHLGICMNGRS